MFGCVAVIVCGGGRAVWLGLGLRPYVLMSQCTHHVGMSQYSETVRDHVTTGNTMLALSDSDMEKKLGMANALHRRKLRLAIEEKRRPDK